MKTEVKPVAENQVQLEIEVPGDEVQRRYDQTLTRIAREASIPGFRKGRVPKQIILGRLGDEYVRSETLQEFLPEWYDSALRDSEVDAVSMPELDLSELKLGEPFSFKATVQVRPTPVLGVYKGLEVPKRGVEVTDDMVDAQLAMMQERFASLTPVEDRAVEHGDFVVVDLHGSTGGQPIEGADASNYMVQVGAGQLIPGFEDNLVGMAGGEHKEFDVTFPEDYAVEELRGKPATFAVDVKEIKRKVVPELSDEFAQEISELETLDELKADVRERSRSMQQAAADRDFRSAVVDAAVANATFEVPSAMIEREAHNLLHDLESTLGEQGMTMEAYLKAIGKTEHEVEEELKPRAEANVRRRLVIDAVRAAEDIQVTDDDVRERITADAGLLGRDPEQLIFDVYTSGRQAIIKDELLVARTVDFLVEHAVPTEMPPETTELTEEDDAAPEGEA